MKRRMYSPYGTLACGTAASKYDYIWMYVSGFCDWLKNL